MATVSLNYICDLNQAVRVQYVNGNVFSGDNGGNTINVYVMEGGQPATINGEVIASVIRADGATVAVSGSLSGNCASITLSQSCYAIPGPISIVIKLTLNEVITTICALVANVYRSSTDTIVDPGTIMPSIQDLIDQINAAVATIPSDYSSTQTAIKEFWRVFGENNLNINLAKASGRSRDFNNVLFTANDGVVTVDGTSIGVSLFDMFSYLDDPASFPLLPGHRYALTYEQSDSTRLYVQIQYTVPGNDTWIQIYSSMKTADVILFDMPAMFEKFVVRLTCDASGLAYNNKTVAFNIINIDKNGLNRFDEAVLEGIKTGRILYNQFFPYSDSYSSSYASVQITNDGENITLDGTSSGTIAYMLLEDFNNTLFKPGDKISIDYNDPDNAVYIECVTKKGSTTHTPLLQTTATGVYIVTFPEDFDYCRINLIIMNGETYDTTVSVRVESSGDSKRTITVAKDGTGDYTKITDAVKEAVKSYGTTVIVKPGNYDLVAEYGEAYLDSLDGGDYGMMLQNGVTLLFAPTAYVTFDYDGQNTWIIQNFAPFNTGNNLGFTVDGLNCMARNCRYIFHDDPRPGNKDKYSYNIYRNCRLEMYPSPDYAQWVNHQIIGGGLGDATSVLIENCVFIDHFSGVTEYPSVSYHNSTSGNQHYESRVTVKDCYFADGNTLEFEGYGSATEKTQVIITNNCLQNPETDIIYDSTVDNMEVLKWNNAGRG